MEGQFLQLARKKEASGHWVGVLDRLMDRLSQTHRPCALMTPDALTYALTPLGSPWTPLLPPLSRPCSGEHTPVLRATGAREKQRPASLVQGDTSLPEACYN